MEFERQYMERALELAARGAGHVSPNPMVGAVIVSADGRIIGEGWHRRYGGPHAEVNAVRNVSAADEPLLPEATIYVTLEPCSHYGKTPPCAKLLIEKRLKRVVIGSADPFVMVSGRGVKMLREAGIEVIEDFMRQECDELNRRFITAHTLHRPWIQLKWAQSADGFIAGVDAGGNPCPVRLSTPLTLRLMHRERSMADAIMVGVNTVIIDNPSLTLRHWPGRSPRPVTFDSPRLSSDASILQPRGDENAQAILLNPEKPLEQNMRELYSEYGITSLMVEGGARTLESFLRAGLYDEIRVETSPLTLSHGLPAPKFPIE